MSEYIITIEQIKDLVTQSAVEAIDGYKSGVVKQIWQYPLLPKIVRCRDCEHYRDRFNGCVEFGDESRDENATVEPDGFCAWACRKEGDDDRQTD